MLCNVRRFVILKLLLVHKSNKLGKFNHLLKGWNWRRGPSTGREYKPAGPGISLKGLAFTVDGFRVSVGMGAVLDSLRQTASTLLLVTTAFRVSRHLDIKDVIIHPMWTHFRLVSVPCLQSCVGSVHTSLRVVPLLIVLEISIVRHNTVWGHQAAWGLLLVTWSCGRRHLC